MNTHTNLTSTTVRRINIIHNHLRGHQSSTTPSSTILAMAQKPAKPFISTHVLDTTIGVPAANLPVTLFKLNDYQWTSVNSGVTNADGRYENNLLRTELNLGRYKFHFATEEYFRGQHIESLYPFIEVVFDVKTTALHYHIPLLLQPNGYTTYRGS